MRSLSNEPSQLQKEKAQPVVLVVDDDWSILSLWEEILQQELNCRVLVAPAAAQALRMSFSAPPDLVIVDFWLAAAMNGIELVDELRRRPGWQHIPIVMVSANMPVEAAHSRGLMSIHKPFDLNNVFALIEPFLSAHAGREYAVTG